jgi:hypothetical protein
VEQELLRWVQGVGFPAAIAVFVLVRLERRLAEVARALTELRVWLAAQKGRTPPTTPEA